MAFFFWKERTQTFNPVLWSGHMRSYTCYPSLPSPPVPLLVLSPLLFSFPPLRPFPSCFLFRLSSLIFFPSSSASTDFPSPFISMTENTSFKDMTYRILLSPILLSVPSLLFLFPLSLSLSLFPLTTLSWLYLSIPHECISFFFSSTLFIHPIFTIFHFLYS